MRRKKKKLKLKRIILLCLLGLLFWFYMNYQSIFTNYLSDFKSHYTTIAKHQNDTYSGTGQTKCNNQDGYFTTFTTEENHQKTYTEYKQNGDASWSSHAYWGGTMEENGCGITALSIILSGYNKNVTPEDLRKKYQPVLKAEQIASELTKTFGIENSDFYFDNSHLSEEEMIKHLETNRPILICVWNQPHENRWTEKSHYMVLLATDGHKNVYISNPNGGKKDSKSSGWYNINEVAPYIAKALYINRF